MQDAGSDSVGASVAEKTDGFDFSFLPENLTMQCRNLIASYHDLYGYSCLPDILWKTRRSFIQTHNEFKELLKKASTTRSAKKSNEAFTQIATTILSLEILSSSFSGWSAIYPEAGSAAVAILRHSKHTPLMDFYLYPPKYRSSAAVASLIPPANHREREAELYRQ